MRLVRSSSLLALFLFGLAAVANDDLQTTVFVGNDLKASDTFWRNSTVVRLAKEERDLPAQLPGPADAVWAGVTPKEVIIPLPSGRETTMALDLADSHESAPPIIAISVEGREVARIATLPGAGRPLAAWETEGKRSSYTVTLPPSDRSDRTVTLSPVEGSWIGIDRLTLSPTVAWWEPWRRLSPWAGWGLMGLSLVLWLFFWLDDARRGRRLGEALGNGALAAVAVTFTFGMGEFILATWFPQPDFSQALAIVYEKDQGAGYRLKPNVRTRMGYDTNRLGMRDYDHYRWEKPAGTYRIVALGDSQTFSWTALDDAWPKRLERSLAAKGKKVELLNAGVPGYGNDDEFYYLDAYGEKLDPDMVILAVYVGNDLLENNNAHDYTVVDGSKVRVDLAATVEANELTRRKRVKEFASRFHWYRLARRFSLSHAFDTLHAKIASDTRTMMNRAAETCVRAGDTRSHYGREAWGLEVGGGMEEDWRKSADYLTRIADWCDAHNVRFLIAVIPIEPQLDTPEAAAFRHRLDEGAAQSGLRLDWAEPQKSLLSLASDKGWAMVDLLPAMRKATTKERLYYCNDIHLNEAGSALAARAIGETIAAHWPDLTFDPAKAVPMGK